MATTTSPMLLSVLSSSSRDNSDDIVVQLRNCLGQIEANVQETLTKIHQRKPYVTFASNNDKADEQMRNHFFDIIKTVANNNNLPFDETLFRQQFFEVQQANNNTSPHVDIVREKPSSIIYDTTDQHLSPITNRQRSQFAPVLSSTPVHQTSPITSIPVDLSMATPSVPLAPPVLTVASTHLPPIPPSAIVPQRANVNRAARKPSVDGRPPRAPPAKRAESATRRKRSSPPTNQKEKEEDDDNVIVAKEVRITSKRRVKSKQQPIDIVEESVTVLVEQREVVAPPIVITKVQTTPLRSRKKTIVEESKEEIDPIPQLEPPPPPPPVIDEIEPPTTTKKTRAGRSKKKEEPIVVVIPSRTIEQPKEPVLNLEEVPKKITRARKKNPIVESLNNNEEENPPPARVRATPLRGKKKIDIPSSSKKIVKNTTTNNNKSKKRKNNEDNHDKPMDSIQPPSPKRRAPGRNTKKTADLSSPEPLVTPVSSEQEPPPPTTIRSSRRGKIDLAEEKPSIQQEIEIITKKVRPGRGKKKNEPMAVDLVRTSDTVSVVPTSSIDSLVAKPPRPPVMRKKKSIELPPLPRMSPSTPPPRVQSISPIRHPSLLPIPMPIDGNRPRRQRRAAAAAAILLDTLPSNVENPKRTRSSAIATPKRIRRENLVLTTVPGTPGKKRNKCTCQKRGNKSCDICAVAIDA